MYAYLEREKPLLAFIINNLFCLFWVVLFIVLKIKNNLFKNLIITLISIYGFIVLTNMLFDFCEESLNNFQYNLSSFIILIVFTILVIKYVLPTLKIKNTIVIGFCSVILILDLMYFFIGIKYFYPANW